MDETVAPEAPGKPRSIGERLRAGRERSGLSIAAAAEKLHLDVKVIESLEADRFAELGASVYVRGHLRRYADFVGEPGAELVSSYTARDARPAPPDLTQVPHAERRSDPRRLVTPFVGLSCAAVLLAAIWWVLAGSRSGSPESASALPTPLVQPGDPATPNTASGVATPVAMSSSTTVNPSANKVPAAAPGVDGATAAAPKRDAGSDTSPAPARETRLKLDLTNDSWIEVYDSRDKKLFYDVASAGSVQTVSGRGPLRVVLGNAAGVTVEVDGQAREIPASAVDGEGARFVVNRSGSLARAR
jgi:cytoskeleton protein RodZ